MSGRRPGLLNGSVGMRRELRGCRVILTGASRGIGSSLAEQLAGAGAKLVLAARTVDQLTALADQLKARKMRNLKALKPDVIAAGNLGCITQIGSAADIPVLHTVELMNWAYGGKKPAALK